MWQFIVLIDSFIYIYIYIIKKKSLQDDVTPKKKKVEKKEKKRKQQQYRSWIQIGPIATVQNLKKKKRFNKPNVYCSGIGAFYIVNRLLCFSHCFLQTSKSKSTLELTRSVYIIYALLLKWYIVHFALHLFSIDWLVLFFILI